MTKVSDFSRIPVLKGGVVTYGSNEYYQMLQMRDPGNERLAKSLMKHLQHSPITYLFNAGPESYMPYEFSISVINQDIGAGVLSSSANYGWGRFEGMKFIWANGKAYFVHPDDNFDRMREGGAIMNVPFDFSNEKLTYESILIVGINGWLNGFPKIGESQADKIYMRPLDGEFLNTGIGISGVHFNQLVIIPIPMTGYFEKKHGNEGVNVLIWDTPIRQAFATDSKLALKNNCSYTWSSLLKDEANAVVPNAGETIIFNNGLLKEGTSDTVMIIKNGVAYIPPLSTGRLNGTTSRLFRSVLENMGIHVIERNITLAEVLEAHAVYLLGNAVNMMGVETAYFPMEAVAKYSACDSLATRKERSMEELTVFKKKQQFAKVRYGTTEQPLYKQLKNAFEEELLKYSIAVDDILVPNAQEKLDVLKKRINRKYDGKIGRVDTIPIPNLLRKDAIPITSEKKLWPNMDGKREATNTWSSGLKNNPASKLVLR